METNQPDVDHSWYTFEELEVDFRSLARVYIGHIAAGEITQAERDMKMIDSCLDIYNAKARAEQTRYAS